MQREREFDCTATVHGRVDLVRQAARTNEEFYRYAKEKRRLTLPALQRARDLRGMYKTIDGMQFEAEIDVQEEEEKADEETDVDDKASTGQALVNDGCVNRGWRGRNLLARMPMRFLLVFLAFDHRQWDIVVRFSMDIRAVVRFQPSD